MRLTFDTLIRLESLFIEKNWKIEKEEQKFSSIFNRFCSRLGIYDEEKQNLILELTADFLNVPFTEVQEYFSNSLNEIKDIQNYKILIICPLKPIGGSNPKSSDHLWYHLKSFCDFSYEPFKKNLRFISDWNAIKDLILPNDSLLVLIDDFIGTGKTVNDSIDELKEHKYLINNNFRVLSLVGTEFGVKNVTEKHGHIVACNKLINRGISDKYSGITLLKNTVLMNEIEEKLKVFPDFKFGYGQCESLIAIENKSPNNTFPVFWLDKKNKLAPFNR
jgi:hypothetical protein